MLLCPLRPRFIPVLLCLLASCTPPTGASDGGSDIVAADTAPPDTTTPDVSDAGASDAMDTASSDLVDMFVSDAPPSDVTDLGPADVTSDVPIDTPSTSSALIDDATAICAWTTACLNPEASGGGGAPNTSFSSCIATYVSQHVTATGSQSAPWNAYRSCLAAHPSGCIAFRSCLSAAHAICGGAFSWTKGSRCPDDTFVCDTSCSPSCAAPSCLDANHIARCPLGHQTVETCNDGPLAGGMCLHETSGATPGFFCVRAPATACSVASHSCSGTVATTCDGNYEVQIDCAQSNQICTASPFGAFCQDASECRFDQMDTCTGNTLGACIGGHSTSVDCTTLGGTCGTLRSGYHGCVFPD